MASEQTPTTVMYIHYPGGASIGIYTATVTSDDWVKLTDFTDILNWYVIDVAANTEATATQLTNVLTITQVGLLTAKILIYVQGA